MHKADIAALLKEIGTLLELKGENPFKVRAYNAGARALEQMEEDFETVMATGRLQAITHIGKTLSEKIETLYRTGSLDFYETLRDSIPPGLLSLREISGLGGKKIKQLHDALGIDTIAALEQACINGQVAALPGFGAKSATNILNAIRQRAAYQKQYLWWQAQTVAAPIREQLKHAPGVERAECAGSLRRKREIVHDLDFIVAASNPTAAVTAFTQMPEVTAVTAKGLTLCRVRLEAGLQADLRIVPSESFLYALHHATGSREHNVQMRQRALSRGQHLSEWGLTTQDKNAAPLAIHSEADLFEQIGLAYIPPELREGRGEIEAAATGWLPELVEAHDIRGAFHNHTTASDGRHTLEEMAAAAQALGWAYLGIADHSKSSFQAKGLDESRLIHQIETIRQLNASGRFQIHIFSGTECDILPDGSLDFDGTLLKELDYVVASVHSAFGQSEAEMTARLIRAIEHPYTTMLGHMTGRLLLQREPYRVDVGKVIDAAVVCNKIIELNANPRRLDMDWRHWRKATEKGLLCSINPDAHSTEALDHMQAGVNVARKGWLSRHNVLNTWSLQAVTSWLGKMKP